MKFFSSPSPSFFFFLFLLLRLLLFLFSRFLLLLFLFSLLHPLPSYSSIHYTKSLDLWGSQSTNVDVHFLNQVKDGTEKITRNSCLTCISCQMEALSCRSSQEMVYHGLREIYTSIFVRNLFPTAIYLVK
jgi:hypothetical protein